MRADLHKPQSGTYNTASDTARSLQLQPVAPQAGWRVCCPCQARTAGGVPECCAAQRCPRHCGAASRTLATQLAAPLCCPMHLCLRQPLAPLHLHIQPASHSTVPTHRQPASMNLLLTPSSVCEQLAAAAGPASPLSPPCLSAYLPPRQVAVMVFLPSQAYASSTHCCST